MNDTVIYRHIKPCGEVFYVGIGCEQRPYSKRDRNTWWHNIVKKYPNYEVQVLKNDLSWEEACELEKILIDYYGRKDLGLGTLVNLTDGGDGPKGRVCTKETRQKMSNAHKGKKHSEESKQKMSTARQNMSEKTKQKMSAAQQKLTFEQAEEIRKRYQTEKTSYRKLALEYGVSKDTISNIINNKLYTK